MSFDEAITLVPERWREEVREAFEEEMNKPVNPDMSTPEERIAAALEYQNLLNSEVVNPDDPDAE